MSDEIRLALYLAVPNPFNPSTIIGFTVPERMYVTLKIYDLLGREVATLKNGLCEKGEYRVIWNASGFASGLYFSRLEANGKSLIQRFLLLK